MSTYTRLKFKAVLRHDTPQDVLSLLDRVLIRGDLGVKNTMFMFKYEDVFTPDINHPFFNCRRWYMLLLATNWDDNISGGKMYKQGGRWAVELDTEFMNYDSEIDQFIDWISPFVSGRKKKQYVGWYRVDVGPQINLYIER